MTLTNKEEKILWEVRRIPVGSKIWFRGEKQGYTVQASNVAFCVCTKPFNLKKTVLYTVIDWERGERNYENLIFPMGAETRKECEEMLERLTNGQSEVSYRRPAKINIVGYQAPNGKKYSGVRRQGINQ